MSRADCVEEGVVEGAWLGVPPACVAVALKGVAEVVEEGVEEGVTVVQAVAVVVGEGVPVAVAVVLPVMIALSVRDREPV